MQKRSKNSKKNNNFKLVLLSLLIVLVIFGVVLFYFFDKEVLFAPELESENTEINSVTNYDGVCGIMNYTCLNGTAGYSAMNQTHYIWQCTGNGTGSNASCSAPRIENGECGSENYTCLNGAIPSNYSDNQTHYTWVCSGLNGGNNKSCGFAKPTSTLNVGVISNGAGLILSYPLGINCGSTCSYSFLNNTLVTLNAFSNNWSNFSFWNGCDSFLGNTCNITLGSNRTVFANFTLLPGYTDGDGDGAIDMLDQCNNTPSDLKNYSNKYGCPIPLATKFNIKPNFTEINLSNISSFEIGISGVGKIYYPNRVISLLKSNGSERYDLNSNINISDGKVFLNSSRLPILNVSARITLYDIEVNSPAILMDGEDCDDLCDIISYNGDTLVFNVSHFTTFEVIDADPSECGNGIIEVGEICDGTNVTTTCVSKGYSGGTLRCANTCLGFNVSGCSYSSGTSNVGNISSCSHDCTFGTRECSGAGYRVCGNYDSDSCNEWGVVTSCSAVQECISGVCVAKESPMTPVTTNTDECDDECEARKQKIWMVSVVVISCLALIVVIFLIFYIVKQKKSQNLQSPNYRIVNNQPNYPKNY